MIACRPLILYAAHMTPDDPTFSTEHRAFFGRRSGKRLHSGQKALFDTLLPELEIALPESGPLDPAKLFEHSPERVTLEIGYGGGEHLARKAAENPQTGFIGCEVFTGGIGKLLGEIDDKALKNVRLYTEDAYTLLTRLKPASLDEAFLLYPDPWPKTRHHKRRFVSMTTLDALAEALKPGTSFHFATDIEDYANWTLAHILRHPTFEWPLSAPGAWHEPYPGWQPTRYEQKARREGRMKSFYFTFRRV